MFGIERNTIAMLTALLERRDWFRLTVSLMLILGGTVLEMASLGMIIPVVQFVTEGDRRAQLTWLPQFLSTADYTTFIQLLMVGLVLVFLVKNVFLIASSYFQQRVQQSISNRITKRLFESYLRQPYEFHLNNSSSLLIRNVQEYSGSVIGNGVGPILTLTTEFMTAVGFLIILATVQPLSTLILVSIFIVATTVILKLTRTRTEKWGTERLLFKTEIMHALLSAFGGIKEIKLFGRDQKVIEDHTASVRGASRTFYLFSLLQMIPRSALEVVTVVGLAAVVTLQSLEGQDLRDTTLVLALFGVVGFRMLPSVNRITQSVQQLSIGKAALSGAVHGLSLVSDRPQGVATSQLKCFEQLEIQDLRFHYEKSPEFVVRVNEFQLTRGESVGVVGLSGSGKSTFIDLLVGLLSPVGGTILVNSCKMSDVRRQWQDRIGYVPQHVFLLDTTIRKNVAFGIPDQDIDNQRVDSALRQANLSDFVKSTPHGLETMVGERGVKLSGGQRQRLGIARALYANPEVIVLDEATSALDEATEREIVESFRLLARERTLIIVAHRVSTLKYCSRIVKMDRGTIVQEGTFQEVVGSLSESTDRGQ